MFRLVPGGIGTSNLNKNRGMKSVLCVASVLLDDNK